MTEAYPLQWPSHKQRTRHPVRARFDTTFDLATRCTLDEIRRLGGRNAVLSTNQKLRQDGRPYASMKEPEDKGAAVYFEYKGKSMCFACDKWDKLADNIQAIRKTIEALRGIERWGGGDMMEEAFSGFARLSAPSSSRPWWIVMGIHRDCHVDQLHQVYRDLAKFQHPDRNGSHELMAELNIAYDEAKKEKANGA